MLCSFTGRTHLHWKPPLKIKLIVLTVLSCICSTDCCRACAAFNPLPDFEKWVKGQLDEALNLQMDLPRIVLHYNGAEVRETLKVEHECSLCFTFFFLFSVPKTKVFCCSSSRVVVFVMW